MTLGVLSTHHLVSVEAVGSAWPAGQETPATFPHASSARRSRHVTSLGRRVPVGTLHASFEMCNETRRPQQQFSLSSASTSPPWPHHLRVIFQQPHATALAHRALLCSFQFDVAGRACILSGGRAVQTWMPTHVAPQSEGWPLCALARGSHPSAPPALALPDEPQSITPASASS